MSGDYRSQHVALATQAALKRYRWTQFLGDSDGLVAGYGTAQLGGWWCRALRWEPAGEGSRKIK